MIVTKEVKNCSIIFAKPLLKSHIKLNLYNKKLILTELFTISRIMIQSSNWQKIKKYKEEQFILFPKKKNSKT
jgi:hypothetical protein